MFSQDYLPSNLYSDTAGAVSHSKLPDELKALFLIQGTRISLREGISEMVLDGSGSYYIKRYFKPRKRLLSRLFASRARREYQNQLFFQSLNIPVPEILVFHEERGINRRAVMVTRALPGAIDLLTLLSGENAPGGKQLDHLLRQLAGIVRKLHDQGFFHNDLHLRNILVHQTTLYLIDSPNGRRLGLIPLVSERYRRRDLAQVDKSARPYLSRSWRMRLYHYYCGTDRLSQKDKNEIDIISHYYDWRSWGKRLHSRLRIYRP
ncbi:MAG: lipopolysaccharide kinase InaA family protein [Pseudomonadales bacterium]|nr:lipopolysaccharide kinase InaA family protein [Pseudomonadales bacterium]